MEQYVEPEMVKWVRWPRKEKKRMTKDWGGDFYWSLVKEDMWKDDRLMYAILPELYNQKMQERAQKMVVALIHEKIRNQRQDYLHKISTWLVMNYDTICIENLSVSNMILNHCLARAISDMGWSEFKSMLDYKCEWYGKNLKVIGRFDPSSKLCSCCGKINKELALSDREWTCSKCNTSHDRDVNAAINIKNFGLRNQPSVTQSDGLPCACIVEATY